MSGIHLALMGMTFGANLPVPIGSAFEGGFFVGQISTAANGVADYNLVIAPVASGEDPSIAWKTSQTTTSGTSSAIDGPGNTAAMIAAGAASHPAADFCNGLTIGGFSDWYFPAKNELEICYFNLKPTTTLNVTNSGTNLNAVPSRGSNYTTGNPSQTPVSDFQVGGTEVFTPNVGASVQSYWSSTELDAINGSRQRFTDGQQTPRAKTQLHYARAMRRVAV